MSREHNNKTVADSEMLDIRGTLNKLVFHWPLYVLIGLGSLFASYLYLRYTRPVYSSTAEIYIKDDKNKGKAQSALEDLDLFNSNKIVENEMEVIKSPLILEDVIRDNKFNIRYFLKGKVLNQELYQATPLSINIFSDSARVGNYLFRVEMLNDDKIKITYPLDRKKKENPQVIYTRFNRQFRAKKDKFSISYFAQYNLNLDKAFEIQVDSILPLVYAKSLEIKTTLVNRQGSVFQLTYEDEIPKRTADLLNAVLATYNKYTLDDKNEITLNTMNFIDGRLASLGNELDVLEREVESFKKARGITEIDQSAKIVLDQAKDADAKLSEAQIQLSVYNEIESYLNNPRSGKPFAPIYGSVDPAINSLINRYEEAQREKTRLSLALQPGNPILREVEDQIINTRNSIKNYVDGYRRNAVIEKNGIQRKVNEVEARISKIPTYEREFINIKRQQGIKENLYNFLLQRKEESAVSYASNIADNKVISPAFIPERPISPKPIMVILFFVLAGVFFATVYIRLKYLLNNKITSKKDIESITDIPVIAEVYKYDVQKKVVLNERTVLTEQVLNLRNSLKFLLAGVNHTPAILFTSSMSGEGKTFISSHLGSALTYNNKKAVLLEFDLRKPKLSQSLGISNASGVTNYLVGLETLDQIIKPIPGKDNLFIIPSGPIPPNPVELIESEKMKELFKILRERFDYIIIDTSPVGMVSDAKSLSPLIDCSLFVIRFNYTPKIKFKELAADIVRGVFPKVGLVFNGVDLETSYGYSNYGYSNYGYGYGNDQPERSRMSRFFRSLKQRMF